MERQWSGAGIVGGVTVWVILAAWMVGCDAPPAERSYRFTQFAMDTVVEYTLYAPSHEAALDAMLAAQAEIERVSDLLWEDDSTSAIYRLNHAAGTVTVPPEVHAFLVRSQRYYRASGGRFDPSIKPVLDLYGFEGDAHVPPDSAALAAALPRVGFAALTVAAGNGVDKPAGLALAVGGVAKGYAVDRAVDVLRERGITSALVNAGGDLYCLGTNGGKPWAVGIRDPDDAGALVDTLYVTDGAVATSGDYERFYFYHGTRFHHLLDPSTGRPARNARSATVLAPSTEEADALATALFVAGTHQAREMMDAIPDAAGMVVAPDGHLLRTNGYAEASLTPTPRR